jgi:hypothetical protein
MKGDLKPIDYCTPWIKCIKCNRVLPPSQFSPSSLKNSIYYCRTCATEYGKIRYLQKQTALGNSIDTKLDRYEQNALDALARNDLLVFGTSITQWENINSTRGYNKRPNIFTEIVNPDIIDISKSLFKNEHLVCEIFTKYHITESSACQQ